MLDSPLEAIAAYEDDIQMRGGHDQPRRLPQAVTKARGPAMNVARVAFVEFCELFEAEMASAGYVVDAATLLAQIEAVAMPRPAVLAEIDRLASGENSKSERSPTIGKACAMDHSRVTSTSSSSRVSKVSASQSREIFERALSRLGADPTSTLMLDDIGPNLKTARAMGMETFKVTSERPSCSNGSPTIP